MNCAKKFRRNLENSISVERICNMDNKRKVLQDELRRRNNTARNNTQYTDRTTKATNAKLEGLAQIVKRYPWLIFIVPLGIIVLVNLLL